MCLDGRSDVEASLGGGAQWGFSRVSPFQSVSAANLTYEKTLPSSADVSASWWLFLCNHVHSTSSQTKHVSLSLSFTLQFIWPGLFSRYCKNKNYMRSPTPALFRTLFSLTATDEKKCGRRKRKCELVLGTKPNYTFQGCVTICARESIHCLTGFL